MSFRAKNERTSFFSFCCDQIPDKKQLQKERFILVWGDPNHNWKSRVAGTHTSPCPFTTFYQCWTGLQTLRPAPRDLLPPLPPIACTTFPKWCHHMEAKHSDTRAWVEGSHSIQSGLELLFQVLTNCVYFLWEMSILFIGPFAIGLLVLFGV